MASRTQSSQSRDWWQPLTPPETTPHHPVCSEACPTRTYRPPGSANKCLTCPVGRAVWVASAATKCDPCPSGSTLVNANDLRCTTCPTGERWGTCMLVVFA